MKLTIIIVLSLLINMAVDYFNGMPYCIEIGGKLYEFKTYRELEVFRIQYQLAVQMAADIEARKSEASRLIDSIFAELEE